MATKRRTTNNGRQGTRNQRSRTNSNGRCAGNNRSNGNGMAEPTDERIDIPLQGTALSLVHWAKDERFQPAQPAADKDGNSFARRTFDVEGWFDFPELLLAQGEYYLENADSLLQDYDLEEVEQRVAALQKLAA